MTTNLNNLKAGDVVLVEIMEDLLNVGKRVRLIDSGVNGFILLSEIYRSKTPSQKLQKKYAIGKRVEAKILRMDGGYMDLSVRKAIKEKEQEQEQVLAVEPTPPLQVQVQPIEIVGFLAQTPDCCEAVTRHPNFTRCQEKKMSETSMFCQEHFGQAFNNVVAVAPVMK